MSVRSPRNIVLSTAAILVAVVPLAVWLGGLRTPAPSATGVAQIQVSMPEYGFGWELPFTADSDWDISTATWEFGQRSEPAVGYNDDVQSDTASKAIRGISFGDRIYMEGHITPACDGTDAVPILVLTWTEHGFRKQTQRISPSNPESFNRAVTTWCRLPLQAALHLTSTSADGTDMTYTLLLHNPATTPTTVTTGDVISGHAHWHPSQVAVDATGEADLAIRVTSTDGNRLEEAQTWPDELVQSNGAPVEIYIP